MTQTSLPPFDDGAAAHAEAATRPHFLLLTCLVLLGVSIIALATVWENHTLKSEPWKDALLVLGTDPIWDEALPVLRRKLPDENFPPKSSLLEQLETTDDGKIAAELLGLNLRESVVYAEFDTTVLESVLASGHLPTPGSSGVLAGPLCRVDSFVMDGQRFEVTGILKGGSAGLLFSFLLPKAAAFDSMFDDHPEALKGWYAPHGQTDHPDWRDELEPLLKSEDASLVMPMVYVSRAPAILAIAGLLLVIVASAILQLRLVEWTSRNVAALRPLTRMFQTHRTLLFAVHVSTYAALMIPMMAALAFPHMHLQVLQFVTEIFTQGELKSLGDAYISKNVAAATWQTWRNNFVVQTFATVLLPGFVPLLGTALGYGKMLLSLAVAGFALCPNWAGIMAGYTYHSITVAIEVEAYTIALFVIVAYAIGMIKWILFRDRHAGIQSLQGLATGIVFIGLWLALAAAYESLTLIYIPQ
ncbi:MAG: hypothetical protein AMXMBFR84_43900 [Candidatus Hydrogenedentota bacterium]